MASNDTFDWSYSGAPNSSDLDAVRFLCGDTDSSDQLVTNSEITFSLAQAGDVYTAAAIVCDSIANRFGREVDTSVGDVSESKSQRAAFYSQRAKDLRNQAGGRCVFPSFGGTSVSSKESLSSNTNLTQPAFGRNQFDNRRGAQLNAEPNDKDKFNEPF